MTLALHQGGVSPWWRDKPVSCKSDNIHVLQNIKTTNMHPLPHILDTFALIFNSCPLFSVYPNRIM